MEQEYPTLSLSERDRRWRLVRNFMKSRGIDCLIASGRWYECYLANEDAWGFVCFPLEDQPTYLTWSDGAIFRHVENCLRGATGWIDDWRVGTSGAGLVTWLREKGFDSATIGIVEERLGALEGCIPYKTWSYVVEHLPKATFVDVTISLGEMLMVKSEEEVALLRHCARVGEMACEAMLKVVKPGVSESEILATVMSVIYSNGLGGKPYTLMLHSGIDNPSWGPPIWLYQAQRPHIVQAGEVVQAELFPIYGGIETQQQMSVALKPVHPVNQECAAVARRSYEIGLKALRPGKTFQEVADAMEVPIAEAGCWHHSPLIHSLNPSGWVGHRGVGIEKLPVPEIEKYKIKRRGVVGGDLMIKPGMVFELETNACLDRHRVNLGGAVLVTQDGVEELNKLPTEMRIVD